MSMALKSSRIHRDSPLPLYHQLKQVLLEQIADGTWKPGELIPGEQELQTTFGLSRTTVRQALRELELDGKVIRYRGRGTFVNTPKIAHSPEPSHSLTRSLLRRGMTPGWRVLSHGPVAAPEDLAPQLDCDVGDSVYCIRRVRLANDEPIGIHTAHVAPAFASLVDRDRLEEGGSMDYLNIGDLLDGSRAERVLEAVAAADDDAEILDVEPGAPVLRILRVLVAADGQPIEHLRAVYRGDRFEYRVSSIGSLAP